MRDFLMVLLECSLSMSVLILGLMALIPLLSKRYAAKWLYYAWLVIVAGLIIPFRFHFSAGLIQMRTALSYIQQIIPGNTGNAAETAIQTGTAHQGLLSISWFQFVGCLWIAGVIAFIVYHGLRHYRFVRMVKRWGEQSYNPQMIDVLQKIKNDMGITKQVKLQICSCVSSPMMIGFLNPVILLPQSDFSEDELPYILRHELVHFKRKDIWYKSLVILATAIHWFNPVVYLMAKAIASQCEISCDVEVVNETGVEIRQRYSETIIGVIRNQSRVQTAFSTNFYGGKKGMKKRIFAIMDTKKKKISVAVVCVLLAGIIGTGTAFAASSFEKISDDVLNSEVDTTSSKLEAYTVEEYEQAIEDYKENLDAAIADGALTKEEAESTLEYMEGQLELLKADNGKGDYVIYKTDIVSEEVTDKDTTIAGDDVTGDYSDGELAITGSVDGYNLGTYDSMSDLDTATEDYCKENGLDYNSLGQ